MSKTFQGLFFEILRTPQDLVPSECSYKKNVYPKKTSQWPANGKI